MVTKEINNLADEIFSIDPTIVHLALIDLEGQVLLEHSTGTKIAQKTDTERIMFYYQVGLRRSRREHFNDSYGETTYVHIVREKMHQLILYLSMLTVYLTLNKSATPDEIKKIAEKIRKIDQETITVAIKSHMFSDST